MFALVDCNNFYASCERVFQPHLIGKPIVVLSNNDGCVIARSNEAKSLGIPMGAVYFKYKSLFETNNVKVFSSNFSLYGDMSSRVMNILKDFSPDIEIYSIDEAFLEFIGFNHIDLQSYCEKIKKTVTKGTGIPISIGIAPTKSLSEIANKIAKKFPKQTKGIFIIDNQNKRIKVLKWIKIEDVWGIGKKLSERLKKIGIDNAYKFTILSDEFIRKEFSIVELRLKRDLLGEHILKLEIPSKRKTISTTRSFSKMLTDIQIINKEISTYAVNCAEKLRKQDSYCNLIMVFIQTNYHRKDLNQYSQNIVIKTDYPTNSSIDIVKYAFTGLKAIYKNGYQYKKAGVIVMGIIPTEQKQLNIFINENPKHQKLMKTIDKINENLGGKLVKLAVQGFDNTSESKQKKLSKRYTTKLDETIIINS